jgi:lipopolysaccharide export LptBFGC system permease protein LptF
MIMAFNLLVVVLAAVGLVFSLLLYRMARSWAFLVLAIGCAFMVIVRIVLVIQRDDVAYMNQIVAPFWPLLTGAVVWLWWDLRKYLK